MTPAPPGTGPTPAPAEASRGPLSEKALQAVEGYLKVLAEAPAPAMPWAAACAGQRRLEAHVVKALTVGDLPGLAGKAGKVLGVTAALAGPSCLHLALVPSAVGFFYDSLIPLMESTDRLTGAPGLRRVRGGDDCRVELAAWDGHGKVILHLGPAEVAYWREWDEETATMAVICHQGCPPAPCPASQPQDGEPIPLTGLAPDGSWAVEHRLATLPHLHPAELAALATGDDPAYQAEASRALRRALAHLGTAGLTHDCDTRPNLGIPTVPPATNGHEPQPRRPPHKITPGMFIRTNTAGTDALAEELARQLLHLAALGQVQAGDLLYSLTEIVDTISGTRTFGRGLQVIHRCAQRFSLLRLRAVRPGDPPRHGVHTLVWEISPALSTLAPVIAQELSTS